MDGRWESKGTYVFYLELITDVLHLFVYVVFFVVVFSNYGLPLHLVGQMSCTGRQRFLLGERILALCCSMYADVL